MEGAMVNKNIIPEGTRDLILDECVRKKELELEIENIDRKSTRLNSSH